MVSTWSKIWKSLLAVIVAFGLALPASTLTSIKTAFADTTDPTVEVVRIGDNDAVIVGDTIQYYVIVHNNNTKYQGGIEVTHELSKGLELVDGDTDSGTYDKATKKWTTGIIDAKGQAALTITAKVTKDAAKLDEVKHTATIKEGVSAELVTAVAHFNVTKTRVGDDIGIKKGDVVKYKIDVENTSKSAIKSVNVTDTMSDGIQIKSTSTDNGKFDENIKVWTTSRIEAGATVSLYVDCTLKDGTTAESVYNSVVNISTDEVSKVESEVAKFNITAEKTSADEAVKVGDEITYDVKIKNEKTKPVDEVNVNTTYSTGLEFVSATTDCGTFDKTSGVWTSGKVEGGKEGVLHVTAKVTDAAKRLDIVSFSYDSTQVDNKGTIESEVAAWTLTKERANVEGTNFEEAVKVDDLVAYSVKVTNFSEKNVSGVKVVEDIAQGLEFVSAETSSGEYIDGIWTTGVIAPDEVAVLTVTCKATEDVKSVTEVINNVNSQQNDSKATVETETVRYKLTADRDVSKEAVKIGDEIIYKVTIKNKNKLDFSGINVTNVLSDGLKFKSAETENGTYDSETNTWTTDVVDSKDKVELMLVATVENEAFGKESVTNTFTSTQNDFEIPVKTEVATWQLTAERINSKLGVWNGDVVDYKLTVKNTSNSAISGVKVNTAQVGESKITSGEPVSGVFGNDVWTTGVIESGQEVTCTVHQTIAGITPMYDVDNVESMFATTFTSAPVYFVADEGEDGLTVDDKMIAAGYESEIWVPTANVKISVERINDTASVWAKDKVEYQITVTNLSQETAVSGTKVDVLLNDNDILEIKKGVTESGTFDKALGIWTTGEIAGSGSVTCVVTCKVTDDVDVLKSLETTTIDNTFTCEQTTQSVTVPVVVMSGMLGLAITSDVSEGVRVGDDITYNISVANYALADMDNVTVTETLSDGLELVDVTVPTGEYDKEKLVWTIDHIDAATVSEEDSTTEDVVSDDEATDDESVATLTAEPQVNVDGVEVVPTEITATVTCKVTEELGNATKVTNAVMIDEDEDSKVEVTTDVVKDEEVIEPSETSNGTGLYQTVASGNNGGSGSGTSSTPRNTATLETAMDELAMWVMLFAISAAAASGVFVIKKRRMLASLQ